MTFDVHTRTIRNLDYRVRTSGADDGPPVFLLHGLFDNGASFAPLAEALTRLTGQPMRVIAPDWRGHGDSDGAPECYWFPDYLADLDALIADLAGDEPVVLIGHSMGGQVASMYAGARPDTVSRLITLDSLNVPDAPADQAPFRYRRWLDNLNSTRPHRAYDTLDAIAERIRTPYPELDTQTRLLLAENWSRPDEQGRYRFAFDPRHRLPFPYGFRAEEAMALWRRVRAPVLCIDGDDSPARHWIDADTMAERRACFADVTHETLPDCGHMLHLQAPQACAGLIGPFLADPGASD